MGPYLLELAEYFQKHDIKRNLSKWDKDRINGLISDFVLNEKDQDLLKIAVDLEILQRFLSLKLIDEEFCKVQEEKIRQKNYTGSFAKKVILYCLYVSGRIEENNFLSKLKSLDSYSQDGKQVKVNSVSTLESESREITPPSYSVKQTDSPIIKSQTFEPPQKQKRKNFVLNSVIILGLILLTFSGTYFFSTWGGENSFHHPDSILLKPQKNILEPIQVNPSNTVGKFSGWLIIGTDTIRYIGTIKPLISGGSYELEMNSLGESPQRSRHTLLFNSVDKSIEIEFLGRGYTFKNDRNKLVIRSENYPNTTKKWQFTSIRAL